MKPFSLREEGKAINLLVCRTGLPVRNAPVKNQCSKNYLHGEDGLLEGMLSQLEGNYSSVCKRVFANEFTRDDLIFLRDFSYFQFSRTETAMRRYALAQTDVMDLAFRNAPERRPAEFTERQLIISSLSSFFQTKDSIADLDVVVVQNISDTDFITSDDPTTILNRFHNVRLNTATFGFGSTGTMLLMPLGPRHAILSYDKGVYRLDGRTGLTLQVRSSRDASIINSAQFIKNSMCLFFADWDIRASLQAQLDSLRHLRRPESRSFELAYDGSNNGVEVYRSNDVNDGTAPRRSMILTRSHHPRIPEWMSFLKFRSTIRDYYDGSGIGHVRNPRLIGQRGRRP